MVWKYSDDYEVHRAVEAAYKRIELSHEMAMRDYGFSWNKLWMSEPFTLSATPYAWQMKISPNTYFGVMEGNQPNRFHRFMQKLCFGIEWSRNDSKEQNHE